MQKSHLKYLICPYCKSNLSLSVAAGNEKTILTGILICRTCDIKTPIKDGIPRFVTDKHYSDSFGLEWNIHNRTQYDSHSGKQISKERFNNETKWGNSLEGQIIIEAGCGSGRFTEWATETGAMILSFDSSIAVDANYKSNKDKENLLIIQASIFEIPFIDKIADKLFCFGVLQHTPNPELAFYNISKKIKSGGKIAADIYKLTLIDLFKTKYWVRPITKRLNKKRLYKYCCSYIDFMWPVAKFNMKYLPEKVGRRLNWQLLVPDYSHYDLEEDLLKEWAYLDIFDMLSPVFDKPKSLKTFKKWFDRYGFISNEIHYGYNGIEDKGTKK